MTSFAAIAFLIAFTGCSKNDLYDQGAVDERNRQEQEKKDQQKELTVNEKYAAAFEKAFGKVGPNVDWGFGRKSSSTRAFTRAGGVAFSTDITFPEDCDDRNFLADVPAGVSELPDWGGNAGLKDAFYIDKAYNVQIYNGAAKLYVKGDIDLSEGDTNPDVPRFQVSTTSEIYLLEGATLKIGQVSAERLVCAAIYIADGATLTTDYPILLNSGMKVYNHGTINVKDLQVNTNSVLYNSGTVKASGTVSAESNSSRIVNNGTIECADVVVNAGAVLNIFEWTVSGTTKINSNNSGWINNNHWKTYDYAYIGGSEDVINNCYLEVTHDFEMNISSAKGSFKINSGGGVLAQNFYGGRDSSTNPIAKSGPFKIEMAENAVFVVENKAQFESGRGEIDNDKYAYGIFGPTEGGYAVFQAKNIVREASIANTWGAVTYRGHLYVSAETHFAQGNDGMADHKFIFEQDGFSINDNIYAAGFKSGKPDINIPETPCCPGFQGDDPNPTYRVIAEDLSATEAGDFDFNDVVFDVEPNEAGNAAKIVVRAAGGIYKLTVEGVEVHEAFGESANANGLYPMINTNPWDPDVKATLIESYSGDFSSDAAIRNTIKGIEIKVYKPGFEQNGIELEATTGKAACKILVDKTFSVVRERTGIADENTNFHKYVQGTWDSEENGFWWQEKKN